MNNNFIKPLPHQTKAPLHIERDMSTGYEVIIIEGVRYDAEYFKTFAYPETDILYSVVRDDEGVVMLTCIRTPEQAKEFFEEIGQVEPAPVEEHDVI